MEENDSAALSSMRISASYGETVLRLLDRLRESFFAIPAACVLAAIGLAQVAIGASRWWPQTALSWLPDVWFDLGVSGARALLSSIAGSTLAGATTAFSITISVIATASTAYGPRLVRNFMTDRRNQFVLGVLLGTFVFALLVLRTVRGADDQPGAAFIPHIAVNLAILLAILDVIVIVFFIHHIAQSIQLDTLSARVKHEFDEAVRTALLQHQQPEGGGERVVETFDPPADGQVLEAPRSGYLTGIRLGRLNDALGEGQRLWIIPRVGDYVLKGERVGVVQGRGEVSGLLGHLTIAAARTTGQDVRFAEQQVVELAVRALSPGTNDPYTAVNAIESLSAGICQAVAAPAAPIRHGRVTQRPIGLEEVVDKPFDHIRPYAVGHLPVVLALLDLAARIRRHSIDPDVARRVDRQVTVLIEAVEESDPPEHDLERVRAHRRHAQAEVAAGSPIGGDRNAAR